MYASEDSVRYNNNITKLFVTCIKRFIEKFLACYGSKQKLEVKNGCFVSSSRHFDEISV